MGSVKIVVTAMDAGLVVARLAIGHMAATVRRNCSGGGGHGLAGTGGFFEQLGFRPGKLFAGAGVLG